MRRHLWLIVIILAGVQGATIVWREFMAQAHRLGQAVGLGPAVHWPGCPNLFCDYSVFWLAGRLAAQSGAASVYQPARFFAGAALILPHEIHNLPFMYPPPTLPLVVLMSLPPIAISYYAFEILSLTVSVLLLRQAKISWFRIAAGLLSPAALWCIYLGQFGVLCGAVLVAGMARLETSPRLSGGLLAALCVKPQYGLLAPVMLLARGERRAWAAAAATLIILFGLSVLCCGWDSWREFLGPDRAQMRSWLQRPFGPTDQMMGTSIFWMARSFNATLPTAYAIQFAASATSVLCTWRLWRRDDIARDHRIAVTICLCLLASPYGYTNDMVAYSIACAMLMRSPPAATDALLALLWLAPAYVGRFEAEFGILPTPICIIAVALIGWRQKASMGSAPRQPPLPRMKFLAKVEKSVATQF